MNRSGDNVRSYSLAGRRLWVAGHRGMVGAALLRRLEFEGCEILTVGRDELDLRRQADVERWMADYRPDTIVVSAATVGGIAANESRPAEFLYDNIAIETNIIDAAFRLGVSKLLLVGSSSVYPPLAPQPFREDTLLSGPLEPTHQWYSIAKIAGLMLCRAYRRQYGCDFIAGMPTNLYGPGDKFDPRSGHVLPALIAKAHTAKQSGAHEFVVWGSGMPLREFMYVDDLADALVFLLKCYSDDEHINIGSGSEITIRQLAKMVMRIVGLEGELKFDSSKPDGAPRKSMDASRLLAMGWAPKTNIEAGLALTYKWYVDHYQ
jgi:GDP-L-fucose synthase